MKRLNVGEITDSVKGKLICGNASDIVSGISSNSKDVSEHDAYFAFIGEKHDGHKFIDEVIRQGCKTIIVSRDIEFVDHQINIIQVKDTITAFQDLAYYYKTLISPITIGITGSVGKTSLKDMLNIISSDNFNTVCSKGNENNHIGVPKTIFRMEEETEVLILEMGMSAKGEIKRLADIGRPDIAAITNIGVSHLENFQDQKGIFDAKMEVTGFFQKDNTLVINGDDDYLKQITEEKDFRIISAGACECNDYIVSDAKYMDDGQITFLIEYDNGIERFTLPVAGLYNSTTAAMSAAIMSRLNISIESCAHSLKKISITPHRLQLIKRRGIKIIDDTYNASPASVKSGLEYLMALCTDRKIAVLGDMKELGKESLRLHGEIGDEIGKANIDYLFTVGELAEEIANKAALGNDTINVQSYSSKKDCSRELKKILKEGDGILIKGSRSMKMEKIVEAI